MFGRGGEGFEGEGGDRLRVHRLRSPLNVISSLPTPQEKLDDDESIGKSGIRLFTALFQNKGYVGQAVLMQSGVISK